MQPLKPKKCKHCGNCFEPRQPMQNTCSPECYYARQEQKNKDRLKTVSETSAIVARAKEIKRSKPIAHKSKTSKNTVRTLTQETIAEVYARDEYRCIIPGCGKHSLDLPHHAYYGSQANRGPDRNEPHQLVTVCTDCHYDIHFRGMTGKREFCIDYLKKHYAQNQDQTFVGQRRLAGAQV